MTRTPLEAWIAEKTDHLAPWQDEQLRQTLGHAQNSPYYRETLSQWETTDFRALPTMTAKTLIEQGGPLLCVHPKEVARIVTLSTRGSTGKPKRVFFTQEDLELTIDYFAHGLTTVVKAHQTMAVCLHCGRKRNVINCEHEEKS